MKHICIIQPKHQHTQHLTSPALIKEDWLASGISPELIEANKAIILEEARENLNAWIAQFVGSFKPGRLRETLESSYFLREEGSLTTKEGIRLGLAVIIRPQTSREFRFLLSKSKALRYRILTRDPKIATLILATPNLKYITATDIASGRALDVINNGEV